VRITISNVSLLLVLTCAVSALVKTYLGQSRSKDALVVAKVELTICCTQCSRVDTDPCPPLLKQELMESQPRSARALVVMVRGAAVATVENCNIMMQGTALAAWDEGVEKAKRALERT
jgi:hypothetical protein